MYVLLVPGAFMWNELQMNQFQHKLCVKEVIESIKTLARRTWSSRPQLCKLYSQHYGIASGERASLQRLQLLDRSSESFGRFADYEYRGCEADMAEGLADEEQNSTAAPASPPADLRTLNTQLSPPYHHRPHLHPRLQHLQPNMLATAIPPRHSHSMLSHLVKTEPKFDAPCDMPLNLKSEVSPWISMNYCSRWSITTRS